MVDAITAVSASAPTSPTQVDRSFSITSEPDNKWVAARQSQIDADQVALKQAGAEFRSDMVRFSEQADDEMEVSPDRHSRHEGDHGETANEEDTSRHDAKLSGESEAIGTVNFDDETPFGHRTAFV